MTGSPSDETQVTQALALLHQLRQQEAQITRRTARRLTDPRHDSVGLCIETVQTVQNLRTEAVRQIMALGAPAPPPGHVMQAGNAHPPAPARSAADVFAGDKPPAPLDVIAGEAETWACIECGYQMTADNLRAAYPETFGNGEELPLTLNCPQCELIDSLRHIGGKPS